MGRYGSGMPISTEWDPRERVWTLATRETFDLSDILALVQKTDWKGGTRFLWDLRALTKGPGAMDEIQQAVELTAQNSDTWRGARLAVLVARDVDYGIARMFGALASRLELEYEVFRDQDAALDWLRS